MVTLFRASNRGRASGVDVARQLAVALVWAFRDGEIAAVTLHQQRAEALAAIGRR